jgi:hypothetical protein
MLLQQPSEQAVLELVSSASPSPAAWAFAAPTTHAGAAAGSHVEAAVACAPAAHWAAAHVARRGRRATAFDDELDPPFHRLSAAAIAGGGFAGSGGGLAASSCSGALGLSTSCFAKGLEGLVAQMDSRSGTPPLHAWQPQQHGSTWAADFPYEALPNTSSEHSSASSDAAAEVTAPAQSPRKLSAHQLLRTSSDCGDEAACLLGKAHTAAGAPALLHNLGSRRRTLHHVAVSSAASSDSSEEEGEVLGDGCHDVRLRSCGYSEQRPQRSGSAGNSGMHHTRVAASAGTSPLQLSARHMLPPDGSWLCGARRLHVGGGGTAASAVGEQPEAVRYMYCSGSTSGTGSLTRNAAALPPLRVPRQRVTDDDGCAGGRPQPAAAEAQAAALQVMEGQCVQPVLPARGVADGRAAATVALTATSSQADADAYAVCGRSCGSKDDSGVCMLAVRGVGLLPDALRLAAFRQHVLRCGVDSELPCHTHCCCAVAGR